MIGCKTVPEKTITLNFRAMSQRQVEAMAAGTILAGGGVPQAQPRNAGSGPRFPGAETLDERAEREWQEQRAQEIVAQVRAIADELTNRNDPPDFSSRPEHFTSGWDNSSSSDSGGYDNSSGPNF